MDPRRRFKFIREIAQGGFGKVYLAEMISGDNFSTVVALKLLHGRWVGNDEIVMRSRDEARLLGKLRHRNIVRVEDLSSINGQCAIVMEYLQGVDLKLATVWLKEHGRIFPRKAACESLSGMATALHAAFNHTPIGAKEPLQVIHRDIKPSNAMITLEGDIKVLDFGTARASFEEREAKTQVLAFGSQAYMAPERMLGEPDTPAADIFSLGITLYELLTLESYGKIHLREERFEPTMSERVDAIDLSTVGLDAQGDLRDALKQMLAYDPLRRPSAAQVMEQMEDLAERMTDAGLKRFAREAMQDMMEANRPQPDPHDPCVGQVLFEDNSAVIDGRATVTDIQDLGDSQPRSEEERAAASAVDLPSGKPSYGADGSGAFAAPPPPPRVASLTPGPVMGNAAVPAGMTNPHLRPGPMVTGPQVKGPSPAADVTSGTLVLGNEPEPARPASGGGGLIKIAIGLFFGFGALVVVAAGAWFFFLRPTAQVEMPQLPTARVQSTTSLSAGSPDLDWSANAAGKGGVILQAPGASEVIVTRVGGFRAEWDGSYNFRLKDLEPGPYRAKVKTNAGGPAPLTDFVVEPGKTCVLVYGRGGAWEKGECR